MTFFAVSVTLVVEFSSRLAFLGNFVQSQLVRNPNHATVWLFQQPREACTHSWNLAPWSQRWLQERCMFPQRNMQSVEGLRPRTTASIFDCSRCGKSPLRDSTHTLQPKLTRERRQAVLIQHDLIRGVQIFERSWTRWHRFFHIFQRLWANWHP